MTIEYVLIRDENDGLDQAEALARAIHGRHIHVNLIPLNPVRHRPELPQPSAKWSTIVDTVTSGGGRLSDKRKGARLHWWPGIQLSIDTA